MEGRTMWGLVCVIWTVVWGVGEGQETRPIVYEVLEDSPAFTFVGNIAISRHLTQKYNDSAVLNSMQFQFLSGPDQDDKFFTIEETTGIIRTGKPIDRDKMCPGMVDCHVKIDVAIVKPIEYFESIEVQVNIMDINDNAPQFPHERFSVKFSEASSPGTSVSLPIALDLDSPQHGVKQYRMLGRSSVFDLRAASDTSGLGDLRLVLKRQLDRERVDSYQVTVAAIDGGNSAKTGTMLVDITVEDSNDHRPDFKDFPYEVNVLENQAPNMTFFTVTAVDEDTGMNGLVTYAFSPRTQTLLGGLFGIDRESGALYLRRPLDYEKETEYQLEITASDGGPDSLSAQTTVTVKVIDVNDYQPHVTINTLTPSDIAQIPEGAKVGSFVAHIAVLDLDHGENGRVTCSFRPTRNSDAFHLNELQKNQYKIVTASELDREMMDLFILNVECRDHGRPVLTGSKNLTVLVKDINDHTPKFSKTEYEASMVENNSPDSYILLVNASDGDAGPNSRLTYDILEYDVSPYVYIQQSTGIVRATRTLDHEEKQKLEFTVMVQDQGDPPRSNTAAVSITIQDVNDEAPAFSADRYSFRIRENGRNQTLVGRVEATDRDSPPYNQFEFSLIENQAPGYFSIDSHTGEIKTRQSLNREKHPMYFLIVVATDLNDFSLSSTVTVTVTVEDENDNFPRIEYPSKENNSVRISNLVPIGFNVLRIRAADKDSGPNGLLTYKLMGRHLDSAFAINHTTGMITNRKDLQSVKYEAYPLTVVVRDGGDPVKAATMDIVVIVDATAPFSADTGGSIRGTNLTIIIVVAAVSGFIMIILIVAIAVMKIYDRRKAPQHVYKCRVEEQKIMAKAKLAEREREKKGKNSKKNSKKQNVSFSMDECGGSKHREASQNDLNQTYVEGSRYTGDPTTVSPEHAAVAFDSYQSTGRPDRQLESHLLNLLKEDHDAESASSTEMSNTDSGRGPSEEGEHNRQGNHMMDGGPGRGGSRSNGHRAGSARPQPDGGRSTPSTANRLGSRGAYPGPPPPPSAASLRGTPGLRGEVLPRAPAAGYGGDRPGVHRQYPIDNGRPHHSRQSPTPMRTFMPDNNGRMDGKMDNSYHGVPKYGVHLPGPHRQRSLGDGAPKSNSQDFQESSPGNHKVDPNIVCDKTDERFFQGVIV